MEHMLTNVDVQTWPRQVQTQLQFLTWLQDFSPEVYNRAINMTLKQAAAKSATSGLGFSLPDIDWSALTKNAIAAGQAIYTMKAQKDLFDLNMDRVKAGEPPVDSGDILSASAPVIRTEIAIQPEIAESLKATFSSNINKVLIVAAAALGAFLIFR